MPRWGVRAVGADVSLRGGGVCARRQRVLPRTELEEEEIVEGVSLLACEEMPRYSDWINPVTNVSYTQLTINTLFDLLPCRSAAIPEDLLSVFHPLAETRGTVVDQGVQTGRRPRDGGAAAGAGPRGRHRSARCAERPLRLRQDLARRVPGGSRRQGGFQVRN